MYRALCVWMLIVTAGCSSSAMNPATMADLGMTPADPDMASASQDMSGGGTGGPSKATICSADSWCWESPLPMGNTIHGLWGSANDSVWAVGAVGTILNGDYDPPIRTYTEPRMELPYQLPTCPNQAYRRLAGAM